MPPGKVEQMSMYVTLVEMTLGVTVAETGIEIETETGGETGPGHVTERDAAGQETEDVTEAVIDAEVAAETEREARDPAVAVVTETEDARREKRENLTTGSV